MHSFNRTKSDNEEAWKVLLLLLLHFLFIFLLVLLSIWVWVWVGRFMGFGLWVEVSGFGG